MFDHQVNHRLASILKQEGTGQWLLNGDRFKNWLHGDDTFLWLHGIGNYFISAWQLFELS